MTLEQGVSIFASTLEIVSAVMWIHAARRELNTRQQEWRMIRKILLEKEKGQK